MRVSVIALILGFIAVRYVCSTIFHATGRISCQIARPWCLFVILREEDFYIDDTIDRYGVRCDDYASKPFELLGEQDGDEHGSMNYTLYFVVTHNCTFNGKKKSIRTTGHDRSIDVNLANLSFERDITMQGDDVEHFY